MTMRTTAAAASMLAVTATMLVTSPALAQQRVTPDSPPRDSAQLRGLRWQLAPLVDGARSVVVPVLPRHAVPLRTPSVADIASPPFEYMIRIIVPDTARLAPMPVMRPAVRP